MRRGHTVRPSDALSAPGHLADTADTLSALPAGLARKPSNLLAFSGRTLCPPDADTLSGRRAADTPFSKGVRCPPVRLGRARRGRPSRSESAQTVPGAPDRESVGKGT